MQPSNQHTDKEEQAIKEVLAGQQKTAQTSNSRRQKDRNERETKQRSNFHKYAFVGHPGVFSLLLKQTPRAQRQWFVSVRYLLRERATLLPLNFTVHVSKEAIMKIVQRQGNLGVGATASRICRHTDI